MASDVPFRCKTNANHTPHKMKFGELWDPYSTLAAPTRAQSVDLVEPHSRSRAGTPMSMGLGLGQLWRPDPRARVNRTESKLVLRSTHIQMDNVTKRMIVNLLEKCRLRSGALFKSMKASDTPDPTTGRLSSLIPAAQFELCIRAAGISAPRAVFNTLLEMVGVREEDGQVDYNKFLEELDIEEAQLLEQIQDKRTMLQAQGNQERKHREMLKTMELERQDLAAKERRQAPQRKEHANSDQRMCIDFDSPNPSSPGSNLRAKSWFKPRHLTSAFGHDNQMMYCLPGGPLGVEFQDSSTQPPIESSVLEIELRHVRDQVLTRKVAQQRAARNNSGNDDAFFG